MVVNKGDSVIVGLIRSIGQTEIVRNLKKLDKTCEGRERGLSGILNHFRAVPPGVLSGGRGTRTASKALARPPLSTEVA